MSAGREQELRDLLPRREWEHFTSVNWEGLLPAPSKQRMDVVPEASGGSCAIHTYAETLTAHLRLYGGSNDFGVDLPNLIRLAWAKGFLRKTGSSVTAIGRDFGMAYGIPLEGTIPKRLEDEMLDLSDGDPTDGDCFVLGTTVDAYKTVPLPFGALTAAQAEKSMKYREYLCHCLDICPVVLCMKLQEHYGEARREGEPYRRRNIPLTVRVARWLGIANSEAEQDTLYHCITAYGYECPDETVRTLRIIYQENMVNAPGEEPQRGLYIDPDAFDSFYMPDIRGMHLSKTPAEGYQTVHLSPPPSPPPPPPSTSTWESIRRAFF